MKQHDENLIQTDDASVRIRSLAGNAILPWHYHTEIEDNMFCLTGSIEVQLRNPDDKIILRPGERCRVDLDRTHRVLNGGSEAASYLLVQGVGKYDFNMVDD